MLDVGGARSEEPTYSANSRRIDSSCKDEPELPRAVKEMQNSELFVPGFTAALVRWMVDTTPSTRWRSWLGTADVGTQPAMVVADLAPTPGKALHTQDMTAAGKHTLDDFESLPDPEKREVLLNLLRISRGIDCPEVGDEDLVAAADAVFLEYDRMEQNN